MILNFLDLQTSLISPDLKGNEAISGQGAVQGSFGGETFFASHLQKEMANEIASGNVENGLTRIKNTQKDKISVDEVLERLNSSVKGSSGEDELLEMLKGRVKGSSGEDELLEMLKGRVKGSSGED
ncbi:MAG: hypothetical protein U9P10_10735, partial [Thermodesulfobacteriota bacterium]|nr:hypothetical protein [Thermodesulfobacteriota bacterium]